MSGITIRASSSRSPRRKRLGCHKKIYQSRRSLRDAVRYFPDDRIFPPCSSSRKPRPSPAGVFILAVAAVCGRRLGWRASRPRPVCRKSGRSSPQLADAIHMPSGPFSTTSNLVSFSPIGLPPARSLLRTAIEAIGASSVGRHRPVLLILRVLRRLLNKRRNLFGARLVD
jgi:hypothetical protein